MAATERPNAPHLAAWSRGLGLLTLVLLPLGTLAIAFYAPLLPDCAVDGTFGCQTSPIGQKLFYLHVPAAMASYAAFATLLVASLITLARAEVTEGAPWARADRLAGAAAELGVLLSAIVLFTGSMWGHLEWGNFGYWSNDDTKLVLTLVMFLVYAGYLIVRRQIHDPRRRARVAASYAVLGFVTVPLSYVAQRFWRAPFHDFSVFDPTSDRGGITTPAVEQVLLLNMAGLLVLTAYLLLVRLRSLEWEAGA